MLSCNHPRRSNATTRNNSDGGHPKANQERARATKARRKGQASNGSGRNKHGQPHGSHPLSHLSRLTRPSPHQCRCNNSSGQHTARQPGTRSHRPSRPRHSRTINPQKASPARTARATKAVDEARASIRDSTAQGQTLEPTRQHHNPRTTTFPPRRRGHSIDEHFRPIHMGDTNDFDIEKLIDTLLDSLDPNIPITILITGGPPCPDFSGVRANPSGAAGATGHLFQKFTQIIQQIKQVLQQIPIYILIENVVPHTNVQQDILELSRQLGINPIIVDAEDGGIIHRKRLWWLSVEWDKVKPQLVANTPWDLHWTQTDTPWPRLHNPIAKTLQPPLDTKHFTAPAILQKGGLFHCLTTPAPDEHGRPAPQHCNEKPDTIQRWQADHQRFAPWQYQHKYLVSDADGHKHLAPANMREQMMGFDGQRTANMTPDKTEYHRNKALGNTWHTPSAIWLLLLMVMDTTHTPTTAIPISRIQRATSVWLATSTSFGPPPKPTHHLYMPQFCWREHTQRTQSLDTSHTPKPLDPTLEWVIQHSHLFHPVADFREQVVLEIRRLVEDMQELTDDWLRDLPQHVQKAYTARKQVTQVPVFTSLLRQIDYPQADIYYTRNFLQDFASWDSFSREPIGTSDRTTSTSCRKRRKNSRSTTTTSSGESYNKPESMTITR